MPTLQCYCLDAIVTGGRVSVGPTRCGLRPPTRLRAARTRGRNRRTRFEHRRAPGLVVQTQGVGRSGQRIAEVALRHRRGAFAPAPLESWRHRFGEPYHVRRRGRAVRRRCRRTVGCGLQTAAHRANVVQVGLARGAHRADVVALDPRGRIRIAGRRPGMIRRRAAAFGRAHRAIDRTFRIAAGVRWAVADVWTAMRMERGRDARSTRAAVRHVGVHGALDLWRLTAVGRVGRRQSRCPAKVALFDPAMKTVNAPPSGALRGAPWINGVEVVKAAGVVLLLPHETGLPICDCPVAVVDELRRCAGGHARPAFFRSST